MTAEIQFYHDEENGVDKAAARGYYLEVGCAFGAPLHIIWRSILL